MAATPNPNQASSGQRRACSTVTIQNDRIALTQCPSSLSAPILMSHYYSLNAILQPPHTSKREVVVLAASPIRPHRVSYEAVG